MRLALLGCGLLGGSLAAAWRAGGSVESVTGYDREPAHAQQARSLGWIDRTAASVADAVEGADCIALATPVGAMAELLGQLARHARADAIVTDVGSTKGGVIEDARRALGAGFARFVPAHPIAGGALPGAAQARADLFSGRWVVTTPEAQTGARELQWVESAWRSCGATVERMTPAEHDRIFAAISHLPHLLAFALVDHIGGQPDGPRKLQFAGAGFRDFSRIAASDPEMWRDIAMANREALAEELLAFRAGLDALQDAVASGDGKALFRVFDRASRIRREHDRDGRGAGAGDREEQE